jgi:hypothetical protein
VDFHTIILYCSVPKNTAAKRFLGGSTNRPGDKNPKTSSYAGYLSPGGSKGDSSFAFEPEAATRSTHLVRHYHWGLLSMYCISLGNGASRKGKGSNIDSGEGQGCMENFVDFKSSKSC